MQSCSTAQFEKFELDALPFLHVVLLVRADGPASGTGT